MKAIILIKFCVAVLLTIVPDGVRTESITKTLERVSTSGGIIGGIFKPALNGFLSHSHHGTLYRGQLIPLGKEDIAMKFKPFDDLKRSKNEYEMYTYLNAVNESSDDCLRFGIPKIYYYGTWNNSYTMLAMTLLKFSSQESIEMTEEDVLIASREFVKTIKYIHSQGISHAYMMIESLVIQDGRGYIYNFDYSTDLASSLPQEVIGNAKFDLKYFLFSLLKLKSTWQWFGFSNEASQKMSYLNFFTKEAEEVAKRNELNGSTGLKRFFAEFWKQADDHRKARVKAADGTQISVYDHLYQFIDEEMKNRHVEAPSSDLLMADISHPFDRNEWPRPPVDYEYFERKYSAFRKKARKEAAESSKRIQKSRNERNQS